MNQDVARDILKEDEEHIAKDKHWADHLPDRAHESSNESRIGDVWYNPEYIELLVDQQVHPSFESAMSEFFKSLGAVGKEMVGAFIPRSASKSVAKPEVKPPPPVEVKGRVVKEGTGDFSAYATDLRMTTTQPFWTNLIKFTEEFLACANEHVKYADEWCSKCETAYKAAEKMQPPAALKHIQDTMKRIGTECANKPHSNKLGIMNYLFTVDGHSRETLCLYHNPPHQRVLCAYPTQAQYDKLVALIDKLNDFSCFDFRLWTLDDTDELKWWDHHFPGQSEHWGPMLSLLPYAGETPGFDSTDLNDMVYHCIKVLKRLLVAVSDVKSQ